MSQPKPKRPKTGSTTVTHEGTLVYIKTLQQLIGAINRMSQATDNFSAAVAQLDTDVKALVAQGANGAQAAVDAFAAAATASVAAIDAEVKAALPTA